MLYGIKQKIEGVEYSVQKCKSIDQAHRSIMDMVLLNSPDFYPYKKWYQFWKKSYADWIKRHWTAKALADVLTDINPEETPFYEHLKTIENSPHEWSTDSLKKEA